MGVTLKMKRDAKVALQVIYTQFRERGGQWPTFAYFERWLYRFRRQDAVQVLSRIPDEFLKPLTFLDGRPDPGSKLVLTVAGVAQCRGSDDDVQNVVAAVQCLVRHDTNYDLPENMPRGVPISLKQLAGELNLPQHTDPNSGERLLVLLQGEGLVMSDEHS